MPTAVATVYLTLFCSKVVVSIIFQHARQFRKFTVGSLRIKQSFDFITICYAYQGTTRQIYFLYSKLELMINTFLFQINLYHDHENNFEILIMEISARII